ncbi:MAG TPA: 2-C-methyl-D-erythritol 4-phosphate cytidylyltransferase [Sediminibacterium sp.]|nr:2-C-methyl-D-erythritol 4-phosphate cytidylyltransferase [Sediminibacterium sp.]
MKKFAVIVAGGSGTRMGSIIPKQFLLLAGKQVLVHTMEAFLNAYTDLMVILVVPANVMTQVRSQIADNGWASRIILTDGGESRFQSVKNGLNLVSEPSIVFVHDGVRCLVSKDLIQRCYTQALATGSAIPVVTSTDSVRMRTGDSHQVVSRTDIFLVQTPQTFHSALILPAFRGIAEEAGFTDEATVVEASGKTVTLIEGEYTNIKITRPADLALAEAYLAQKDSSFPQP